MLAASKGKNPFHVGKSLLELLLCGLMQGVTNYSSLRAETGVHLAQEQEKRADDLLMTLLKLKTQSFILVISF